MPTSTTKELTTLKIANRYHHTIKSRFAIVNYAIEHGIKGAARRFGLDRKTVRAWCRRWQGAGLVGLVPRYPPIRAPPDKSADQPPVLQHHSGVAPVSHPETAG
jgi:transposase